MVEIIQMIFSWKDILIEIPLKFVPNGSIDDLSPLIHVLVGSE